MWGAIIGGAIGLASSLIGGSAASDEAAENAAMKRRMIAKRKVDNENWYNRRYNEDSTQRADAQRILQITEDSIRRRNKASAGRAAIVGGGGDEQTAREKEANNRAYANAVGQIAAEGQRRKDAIEEKYEARKDALVDAEIGIEDNLSNQRIANIRSATQGITGLAGSIGAAFDKD